jgi:hypothetical protein
MKSNQNMKQTWKQYDFQEQQSNMTAMAVVLPFQK